ncbi:MAG: hypothetical protein M0R22_07965 [Dehalococcoidia bacterium]|jgi:hypothetical protein|nr:hypothetical protein [Dehalococcoidia bacterium]
MEDENKPKTEGARTPATAAYTPARGDQTSTEVGKKPEIGAAGTSASAAYIPVRYGPIDMDVAHAVMGFLIDIGARNGFDPTEYAQRWTDSVAAAAAPAPAGKLSPAFAGTLLGAGPVLPRGPFVQVQPGELAVWVATARDSVPLLSMVPPVLTRKQWLTAAEFYIAVSVILDRIQADPLDTWLQTADHSVLADTADAVTRLSVQARTVGWLPQPPAVGPELPLPPLPVFRPAPVIPVPLGPVMPTLVGALRRMATVNGKPPGAYEWPHTKLLPEVELVRLWKVLDTQMNWAGRPSREVDRDISTVFGPPPYYFLKPGIADLRLPREGGRGRRAVVRQQYRAERPGPNYQHHGGSLYDHLGRLYDVGMEMTSTRQVLYYKRPSRTWCEHPVPDEPLVLRHSTTATAASACPGHRVIVEATRILPRAATGIVLLRDFPASLATCIS